MVNKVQKVTVEIGATLRTDEIKAASQKMTNIIASSGIEDSAKRQANVLLKEMEAAQKKIQEIQSKGTVGAKDLAALNQYFSVLENNYNSLNLIIDKIVGAPTEEIKKLKDEITGLETKIKDASDVIKQQFAGAFSEIVGKNISFDAVDKEINKLDGSINELKSSIDSVSAESYDSTMQKLQDEQKLRIDANKKIASDLQKQVKQFKDSNGEKYKSYKDFIDDYNSMSREITTLGVSVGSEQKRKQAISSGAMTKEEVDSAYQRLLFLKQERTEREATVKAVIKGAADIKKSQTENLTTEQMVKLATEASNKAKQTEESEIAKLIAKRDLLIQRYEEAKQKIDIETQDTRELIAGKEDEINIIQQLIDKKVEQLKIDARQDLPGVTGEINGNKQALDGLTQSLSKAQATQKVFGEQLGSIGEKISSAVSLIVLLRQAFIKLKEASQVVANLDKEITDIAIVTQQTTDEVWASFDTFNRAAKELSTTTKQYLEGAKIFYQQGMNTAQVMRMVEATTKAAALSGVSFRDASETLTAAINAYNMEATEAMNVTDKFAAVGAASAADFAELSTAMEKVASQAYSSGMSFDSLLGILAKGIETTREAPEAIGTGLKSIIARFQEMKENPMATLEDGVNANRVEKALKTVGVAVRDANGEFRNMDEVFADLGEAWKGMSRNQRAYIATMAAGSRQQSRFMAIMNDYDRTLQLVRTSTNSAGEANAQYVIYEDSVSAAQQRMNNSLEQLYTTLMSSDALKIFYDLMAGLFEIIANGQPVMTGIIVGITSLIATFGKLTVAMKIQNSVAGVTLTDLPKQVAWIGKLIGAEKLATDGKIEQATAQTILNVATGVYIALAAAAVIGIVALYQWWKKSANAVHEYAIEQAKQAEESKSEYNTLKDLTDRYELLSKKINKTKQEQQEYADVVNEIAKISPESVLGVDSYGNYTLVENDRLKEQLKLKQQIAAQDRINAFEAKKASMETGGTYRSKVGEGAVSEAAYSAGTAITKTLEDENRQTKEFIDAYISGKITVNEEIYKKAIQALQAKDLNIAPEELVKNIEGGINYLLNSTEEELKKSEIMAKENYNAVIAYQQRVNNEIKAQTSAALYDMSSLQISALEDQGVEISSTYKEVASSFANNAIKVAEGQGKSGAALMTEAERLQSEWLNELEKIRISQGKGALDGAIRSLKQLAEQGATTKELNKEMISIANKFGIEVNSGFYNTLFSGIYDAEKTKQVGELIKKQLGVITFDETIFENLSGSLTNSIVNTIDSIDNEELKKKFAEGLESIFSGSFVVDFEKQLADTDLTNVKEVNDLLKTMTDRLTTLGYTSSEAMQIADSMFTDYIESMDTYLQGVKSAYDEIKKVQDLIKKSSTGLSLVDVSEFIGKYGEQVATSIKSVGDSFYISSSFITAELEKQYKIIETNFSNLAGRAEKNIQDLQVSIQNNLDELDKGTKKEFYGSAQGGKEVVRGLTEYEIKQNQEIILQNQMQIEQQEAIKKAYDDVYTSIQNRYEKEIQLYKENASVIDIASAISASISDLKAFGDIYQKLQDGSLSFLDTMQLIASDPSLLAAVEVTEKGFEFTQASLKKIADQKKNDIKEEIQNEIIKLEAQKKILKINLDDKQNLQDAKNELYSFEIQSILDTAVAQNEATNQQLEDWAQLYGSAYNYYELIKAIKSELGVATATDISKATMPEGQVDIGELRAIAENAQKSIMESYGAENTVDAIATIDEKIRGLNGSLTEIDKVNFSDMLNQASGSAKKASGSVEELNDSLEKYYNTLKRIEQIQSDISLIESRIDLEQTGAEQDLKLLEEKAQKTADLIKLQEYLNEQRKADLEKMKAEQKLYGGFVQLQDGVMVVAQEQLSALIKAKAITQERYDEIINYAESFNQLSSSIQETEQSIIDLQKQQEEMYNQIIDRAIEIRQQIYDAIVEADQREIDQLTKKYDKMKELEDSYLNAVKKSIDEERAARDDAQKAEDLVQKKRRLAILERDTSGIYATEAAKIQEEISKDEQAARDAQVDAQMKALEEQIKLQQEQRDTQIKLLEDQKLFREETGYYWDRVDEAIQNGPAAMQDLLTSTQEYQQADPLSQQQQYEQIKSSTEYLAELVEKGIGINGNQHNIVGAITSAATEIANALGQKINAENISANANGGGGGGSNQTPTSPASSTPKQTVEQQYNQGTSTNLIKTLQTFLNNYLGAKLSVDGIAGDKTDSFMNGLWDNAIRQALNQGKTGFASIFQNAKSTKQISSTAKSALVSLYGSRYNMIPTVKYKEGGIVDFTGPAWVDGTSGSPEAFLNARQTAIFEGLRDYLTTPLGSNMLGSNNISNSTSIGDIVINLQNSTGASAKDIADQVKKELTNIMVTKNTLSIQKVR